MKLLALLAFSAGMLAAQVANNSPDGILRPIPTPFIGFTVGTDPTHCTPGRSPNNLRTDLSPIQLHYCSAVDTWTAFPNALSVVPATAGGTALGSATLPFSGLYLGNAATNNAQLTGTFGQATTLTVPDPGAATATLAYRNIAQTFSGTQTFAGIVATGLSGLTSAPTPNAAGGVALGTAALPFSGVVFGTAATNNVTLTSGAQAAARTISVPDYGLATQQFPGTVVLTGSAYTNATTTLSNVTGLSFPVAAGTNYTAECYLTWQGSAGTTGPKWTFTGPATPTAVNIGATSAVTATTLTQGVSTAFGTSVNNAGTITTATNFTDRVTLGLVNGANAGTVQLQAAANGAGTLTVQPGSYCKVQ